MVTTLKARRFSRASERAAKRDRTDLSEQEWEVITPSASAPPQEAKTQAGGR